MTGVKRGHGVQGGSWAAAAIALALVVSGTAAKPAPARPPVNVAIFALNDLHGNLLPPPGGIVVNDPKSPGGKRTIDAGGIDHVAALLKRLKAGHRNSIFVAAGDLVGASPLLSGSFHDEPTVEALSRMGLEASAVGNHEFDKGVAELRRLQGGGCSTVDGCRGGHVFKGAGFHYLAASPVEKATNQPVLPPYYIKQFEGIPVAFIGLTLKGTSDLIAPDVSTGLEFRDEAQTVNALIPELRQRGIEAIVVLIHEGGTTAADEDYNGCKDFTGPIIDIVKKLDKAVDVVVSGHTHHAYNCVIDGRIVSSAHRYGTLLTEIDLKLDRTTHDVVSAKAVNHIVQARTAPDPQIRRLVAHYQALAGPLAGRAVATIPAPLVKDKNPAGEMPLGDLIADAMLAAGDRAHIAVMNPGGVRVSLAKAGPVTHGDLFAVLPFGNAVETQDLTGAQLKTMLELQWSNSAPTRILQVSRGFAYAWDDARPAGDKVLADTMMLDGALIRPEAVYRVAMPDFLAQGGDGQLVLREGANRVVGMSQLEAVENYLAAHVPPNGDAARRIQKHN